MKKTWILMAISILTIGVLAACSDNNNNNEDPDQNNNAENTEGNENNNSDANENNNTDKNNAENGNEEAGADQGAAMEPPEADLDGIPDVVADINGDEITKDDFSDMYQQQFQQQAMQAQMSGQDPSEMDQDALKEQTAEAMVGQTLLIQEAQDKITDLSEDDIDKTLNQVIEQNGMETKEELLEALKAQDMDEDEFMSEVELQAKVDLLVDDLSKDIEISEEETKNAYETLKSQQEQAEGDEEMPEFDDIKSDLEEQLKDQKAAEETNSFVEDLREEADVNIYL